MKRRRLAALLLTGCLMPLVTAAAQNAASARAPAPTGEAAPTEAGPPSTAEMEKMMVPGLRKMRERWEEHAPAEGEELPNLPVYTSDGEQSHLHDILEGRYTVLVLGCLT